MLRLVAQRLRLDPRPGPVDSRNQTETCQCPVGRPEVRQEAGPVAGRELRTQEVIDGGGGASSTLLDRKTSAASSAASSSSVGLPLTTLTSGSSFTVRAYDEP